MFSSQPAILAWHRPDLLRGRRRRASWLRRQVRRCFGRPAALGELKTGASSRDIPASDAVLEALAGGRSADLPRQDGQVFSSTTGRALAKAICGHVFDNLEQGTGLTVSPHSLRHYFRLVADQPRRQRRRGVAVARALRPVDHLPGLSYLMPADEDAGQGRDACHR